MAVIKSEINYNDIDKEMVELIKAMNRIPYITTTSCCIGHGKSHALVSFEIPVADLVKLKEFICECLYSFDAWTMKFCLTDPNAMENTVLCLESYTNDYDICVEICKNLTKSVNRYCEKYNFS